MGSKVSISVNITIVDFEHCNAGALMSKMFTEKMGAFQCELTFSNHKVTVLPVKAPVKLID